MTAHLISGSYWLVIVDLSSSFEKQKVSIDLSQVALVTDRVAPICKRIYKLLYLKHEITSQSSKHNILDSITTL